MKPFHQLVDAYKIDFIHFTIYKLIQILDDQKTIVIPLVEPNLPQLVGIYN